MLVVPLDALEPQAPGTARAGDVAQLYLDDVAAAAVTIGGRGSQQAVDLALTAAAKFLASSPTRGGLAVANVPPLESFVTGGLDTRIALSRSPAAYANGAVEFGYADNAHCRYVRLQYQPGVWKLVPGQAGTIGTVRASVKASRTLRGLRLGRWYRLWVDLYAHGRVNVFFNTRTASPVLTYTFTGTAPGMTG